LILNVFIGSKASTNVLIFNSRKALQAAALTLVLSASSAAIAQQYTISTVAGGALPATPVTAVNTSTGQPQNAAADSAGNIYFSSGNSVFKLSTNGSLTPFAGNSRVGYSGDGGLATSAQLNQPRGIALDAGGNIYIADSLNNVVRKVDSKGIISTVAGNGLPGYSGDGGSATGVDRINGGMLTHPYGLAVDKQGNLYIADNGNHAVRRVTTDGNINTFAGNQTFNFGYSGDGAAANLGQLYFPTDVAVDSGGNVYIADYGNFVIRQVTTDGNIHTFAGNNANTFAGDGGAPTSASLFQPFGVAVDSSSNVYVSEYGDSRIRKITAGSGSKITTIAGNGTFGFGGDGSSGTSAQLNYPHGLCVDGGGNVYVADWGNNRIRKITSSGTISTAAGSGLLSYSGDGGAATQAQFNVPTGVAADSAGNVYIADTANNVVRQVTAKGVVSTFAGTGTAGFSGDGSAANKAQLSAPQGVAVDLAGNVYIADSGNYRVRVVGTNGNISTFAGNGSPANAGDGGGATSASFYLPSAVATDRSGNVYIADFQASVVRKVANGNINRFAGNGGTGYSGDGGPATSAQLNGPSALALDAAGNLFIAQLTDSRVRKVGTDGRISTIAGTGANGYLGEGLPATASQLASPGGVAADSIGNVFIAMAGNRVMKVSGDGNLYTVAGTGTPGYSGDGGPSMGAQLNIPAGLAMDSSGNLFIADSGNNAVRMLSIAGYGLSINGVTNGASNRVGPISPGEIVVVYGSGLGPNQLVPMQLDSNGVVTTVLAGTRVLFNGTPSPMLYSSGTQVSAVVPFGLTGTTAQVVVQYASQTSTPVAVSVAPTAPAIFTADSSGQGQALANNADGSPNSAANPAAAGSVVTLFATGMGPLSPAAADGTILFAPLPKTAMTVTATVGGQTATVQAAGGVSNNVAGSVQVSIQIPGGTPAGDAPVVVQVGGVSSPAGVTIAVH
jgi:uncharacterized protein (TIGR03437 family)